MDYCQYGLCHFNKQTQDAAKGQDPQPPTVILTGVDKPGQKPQREKEKNIREGIKWKSQEVDRPLVRPVESKR